MARKPTLEKLMEHHHLYAGELAHACRISSLLVNNMANGHLMDRQDAQQILDGFNRLSGMAYRLEDIAVMLREN